MRKIIFTFTFIILSLFLTTKISAQCIGTIYDTSFTWQTSTSVHGYSSTDIDYCAGLYYDPAAAGIFTESYSTFYAVLGNGYSQGYADWTPAEIFYSYYSPVENVNYTTVTDHYVIAYYQVYVEYWGGGWYWYDPFQLGFSEMGGGYEGPGYYGFGYATYWVAAPQFVETTYHSIQFQGQAQPYCNPGQQFSPSGVPCPSQCPPGQQFASNGTPCPNPIAIPTPTPTPTPDPARPQITIKEVGFKNDFPIKHLDSGNLYNPNVENTNVNTHTPSWSSTEGNKFPIAYKHHSTSTPSLPKMWIRVLVQNPNPAYANVLFKIKIGNQEYGQAYYPGLGVQNGEVTLDDIQLSTALPDSAVVRKTIYDLTWEYSSNLNNWDVAGTTNHTIHWLFANPITIQSNPNSPPVQPHIGLYDKALDHSTGILGEGTLSDTEIVEKINLHLKEFITYDPNKTLNNTNPINVFLASSDKSLECSQNAILLVALLNSIGIGYTENNGLAIKFYFGGVDSTNTAHKYNDPLSGVPGMTAQFLRNPEDGNPMHPRFAYHATVSFNGKSYDPSYGVVENNVLINEAVKSNGDCVTGSPANDWKRVRNNTQNLYDIDFGSKCGNPVQRNATVLDVSIPSDIYPGQSYPVSVTMLNTGTNTWASSQGYHLGSQNIPSNLWGLNSVSLSQNVPMGQPVTFSFNITAPYSPGFYDFQWQMRQNNDWFGATTVVIPIEVIGQGCNTGDENVCYWWGGWWNPQTCFCENLY